MTLTRLISNVLREYNIGYSLKEAAYKMEYWEIICLLYASYDNIVAKNEAQKEVELENKIATGKMNMIWKPKRK